MRVKQISTNNAESTENKSKITHVQLQSEFDYYRAKKISQIRK